MLQEAQEFHQSIYDNDWNKFINLLEAGVDINYKAKDDVNALHIAAFKGNVAMAQKLLDAGININDVMSNGATSLFIAAKFNHLNIMALLIEREADLNKTLDNGYSPLSTCIANKNVDAAKLLITAGADIYSDDLIGALEFLVAQFPANKEFILNEYYKRLDERNALLPECDRSAYAQDNEVVVVRYKEPIPWVPKEFPCHKVTVYNKGPEKLPESSYYNVTNIPNVGFYDGTILKHIVDNYYKLPLRTLFVQAFPYDGYLFISMDRYFSKTSSSCNNIIAKCQFANLTQESLSLQQSDFSNGNYKLFNYQNNNLTNFALNNLGNNIPEALPMIWNSQFAVDREVVHRHSQEYYQKLLATIDYAQYPIEAFYFERLWDQIFAESLSNKLGECEDLNLS